MGSPSRALESSPSGVAIETTAQLGPDWFLAGGTRLGYPQPVPPRNPSPISIAKRLAREVDGLEFAPPVSYVYNPLRYAMGVHAAYLERYAKIGVRVVLLGMNPGPWGMAQTGVPFGEVAIVRDWLGLAGRVRKPTREHPKRRVEGFDCPRSEVSGRRLWGWAEQHFGQPQAFFERFFVLNYCPLSFMSDSGANITPDKLPAAEREALYAPCDRALRQMIDHLKPSWVVGVGKFAETRAREVLSGASVEFGSVLHPSPASPAANRGWAEQANRQLRQLGLL